MTIARAICDFTVLFTCSAGIRDLMAVISKQHTGTTTPTWIENLIGSARIENVVLGSPGGAVAPFAPY